VLEIGADCLYHSGLTRFRAWGPHRKTMRIK
jgi:hypothetical protein